jgi:hypothetical protein
MVDWEKIRRALQGQIHPHPCFETTTDLDQGAAELERRVQQVIQELTPSSKPFPYAKRLWTLDLTRKRREYNWQRNRWTSSQRRGEYDLALREAMTTELLRSRRSGTGRSS